MSIDPMKVRASFKGVPIEGFLEVIEPLCTECGTSMMDLGELDPRHAGTMLCRRVVAYGFELARRGDNRPVDHALMRADAERAQRNLEAGDAWRAAGCPDGEWPPRP